MNSVEGVGINSDTMKQNLEQCARVCMVPYFEVSTMEHVNVSFVAKEVSVIFSDKGCVPSA